MKKSLYIILIIGVLIGVAFISLPSYLSTAANAKHERIVVHKGASLSHVSKLLADKGIIRSKIWFEYMAKSSKIDRNIKPGSYTLRPNMPIEEIFKLLQKGTLEDTVVLVIPEGFTIYQIAQRVEELGFGTVDEFLVATKKYFISKNYSFSADNLFFEMEGYLFPDTYYFAKEQDVMDVVEKLEKQMDKVFTEEYKNRAKELGFTKHEVLTIASLIEKEAFNSKEHTTISGVIYNRLNKGMLLQFCSSVLYGLDDGKELGKRLLYSDLENPHSFNTYKYKGLPPGPIASPSKSAIHAALYPEKHEYLYFVVGENGHSFSENYGDHLKNVANYRNIKKESF